jgi:hypothetical protein
MVNDENKPGRGVLELIAKLLALAKDPCNEHEAALAAAKARELLEKYNLSIGEVELEASPSVEVRLRCSLKPDAWFLVLIKLCEEHFQVATIIIEDRTRGFWIPACSYLAICGVKQNVDAAALTLPYLCTALNSLVKARGTQLRKKGKRSMRANARRVRNYKYGAALRIEHEAAALTAAQSQAIVRITSAIARRHIEQNYPRTKSFGRKGKFSHEAAMGWRDAKDVNAFGARPQLAARPD